MRLPNSAEDPGGATGCGEDDLAAFVDERRPVLVLTGAGVSTGSGIPDYRDRLGRRRHADPMTLDRFLSSPEERRRYWARSHLGWARVASAKPNGAHRAVAALERVGAVIAVVTQNVDGLHQAAGSRAVIDLHGRLDAVVCLGCDRRRPRIEVALRLEAVNPGFRSAVASGVAVVRPDGDVVLPDEVVAGFRTVDCRACGGVLKPDVVFFGEHVPRARFEASFAALERSNGLLVLGSSLMVGSGYRFIAAARRRDLPIAIVNRGVTRGDGHAELKVDGDVCAVLPALAAALPAAHGEPALPAPNAAAKPA